MFNRVDFLPSRGTPDSLLTWVIAVMVYLAVLAIGAGLMLHESAGQWRSDIARSLTVQITAVSSGVLEREVTAALEVLRAFPGIESADRLAMDEIATLLEPWLGTGNVTSEMPIPQLIDVTLRPGVEIDLDSLRRSLEAAAPHARLDDHQQWLGRVVDLVVTIQIVALGIIVLISLITIAIVVFATRAGLAAHKEIIEIVHLIGARDAMIAGEFMWRFLLMGVKGSLIGIVVGVATLVGMGRLIADLQATFLPQLGVSVLVAASLATLPLAVGLLTMLTAYITVRRALSQMA